MLTGLDSTDTQICCCNNLSTTTAALTFTSRASLLSAYGPGIIAQRAKILSGNQALQLCLFGGCLGCGELLEDSQPLAEPSFELSLHRFSGHLVETVNLLLHIFSRFGFEGLDEFELLLTTACTGGDGTERRFSCFHDIGLHQLIITKFVTHRFIGFLGVCFACRTGLFVTVTDSWPTASSRVVAFRGATPVLQITVCEDDVRVSSEHRCGFVPRGCLLSSSASSS